MYYQTGNKVNDFADSKLQRSSLIICINRDPELPDGVGAKPLCLSWGLKRGGYGRKNATFACPWPSLLSQTSSLNYHPAQISCPIQYFITCLGKEVTLLSSLF